MKTTVLRAIVLHSIKPGVFDSASPLELTEAVVSRYGFKKAPTVEELAKPVIDEVQFYFGEMEYRKSRIGIEQFSIRRAPDDLSLWIGAATKTTTAHTDIFLEDLLRWVNETYGIDTEDILPVRYHSQLEVLAEFSVDNWLERLRPLSDALSTLIESYGFGKFEFQLAGFKLRVDETHPVSAYLNSDFSFERRANRKYEENCYYSQAPVRTQDHMKLLGMLKKLLED